jgi:hypothetical protein
MKKSWISHLLIILIALQSVMAVADAFETHNAQEATWMDVHFSTDANNLDPHNADHDDSNSIDCHHCNHCHSPHFNFIGSLFSKPVVKNHEQHEPDLSKAAPIAAVTQLYKPPRALSSFS